MDCDSGNIKIKEHAIMDSKEWFKNAKLGMMVHWGLYALLGGEWKGKRTKEIGEWAQRCFGIPNSEYHRLCKCFNPILFDADEWVTLAEEAGMKYLVVTAKHHDGFALFRTAASPFNVVDATPFGRDIIGELADACRRHGLKFGLYYSQDLDWAERDGGYRDTRPIWNGGILPYNSVDFPDNEGKNYSRYFEAKVKPQITELLTNYGDICLVWFDTPTTISPEQSRELVDLVHKLQPGCLVNSRVGNGLGDYTSMADNEIPEDAMTGGLYESACTLNDTWGYKSFDNNWKPAEKLLEIKNKLNRNGLNYLLNVGPDHLGRIPGPAVDILRKFGTYNK